MGEDEDVTEDDEEPALPPAAQEWKPSSLNAKLAVIFLFFLQEKNVNLLIVRNVLYLYF